MKNGGGFTIIEVCLVGVCIGILFAISWPSMRSYAAASALEDQAQAIEALTGYARDTAIFEGRHYRIDFDPGAKSYCLLFEKDALNGPGVFVPASDSLHRRRQLPRGIEIMSASPKTIVFKPDGSAENFSIELQNTAGNRIHLSLDGMGKCVIQKK